MAVKDFAHDKDGVDLIAVQGDLGAVESDQQHVQDIVSSDQGHWKQFPFIGVGIRRFIGSTNVAQQLEGRIRLQLESDGYRRITVDLDNLNIDESISVDAERVSNI